MQLLVALLWICSCAGDYYLYGDDCLDYYATNYPALRSVIKNEHQIVAFCRRDDFHDDLLTGDVPLITFAELRALNVTSMDLYDSSIHLDFVEAYQAFLDGIRPSQSIHACWLRQRFGRQCQYSFVYKVNRTRHFSFIPT